MVRKKKNTRKRKHILRMREEEKASKKMSPIGKK